MQYRIIALTGQMGSGKTTATNRLVELLTKSGHEVRIIKFAAPMYDMQKYIYERAYLDQPKVKDRKLLQWLGTDWGRSINEDLWSGIWELDVKHANFFSNRNLVILTDDVRFDNEAKRVRDLGGAVFNILSDHESRAQRIPLLNTTHASELGVSAEHITGSIYNNSTEQSFINNIDYLFETIKCGSSQ